MSPRGRTWLSRGLALVGFGLLGKVLLETGISGVGGVGGTDANDYWLAARHVLHHEPLYAEQYGTYLAYSYPPLFAQLLAPFGALPMDVFVWAWRLLELLCLRFAAGSWTRAGLALLVFPPVIAEVETGNVHLLVAAVCVLAMRGTGAPIVPAALLKFAALPLVGLGWVRDRRGFLAGVAVAVIAVGGSVVLAPEYWSEYAGFLSANRLPEVPAVALTILPLPVRLALAATLGIVAIRYARAAPFAVLFAYPVVWFTSLSTLVAVVAPLRAAAGEAPQRVPWPMVPSMVRRAFGNPPRPTSAPATTDR